MFDVITIGTATRDVFLSSPLFKVLKDSEHLKHIGFKTGEAECFALGAKLEVKDPVFAVGGGAANTAVTFARQGFKTAALMKVGSDFSAKAVTAELKEENITSLLAIDKKHGTGYSTILLTPGGERTILVYRGASGGLKNSEVPFSKLKTRWAYIAPGTISFTVMEAIIAHLKKKEIKIAMNPSKTYLSFPKKNIQKLFKELDIITVNREEAAYVTGAPYENERKIFRAFDELVPGIAVVTDGPRGAMVSDGEFLYRSGIFKEKKIADRTGAGDAFGSGFVAGLMQKNDIHYALRLASANATSVVEQVGGSTGVLSRNNFSKKRWTVLNLDVEKL
ncbi:MAG: PfkB family kinase, nonfunctional [Candidatus Jorgensenbacteria bacterium GW2011_GWA2_45_13]|uniref:PfkB family kinase, nonfunctional n=1 Tax=Candidatus Jorgensenbacteria bacterium GW2011_GWA2_45_13 TaxID=1618662 RepID=A0A0G1P716_9BACT|nr:MAG: PfkB family kinase, nonfunctional [Candidatus Jorgensenbacteria bacterium GW2011_GWA2_45_13]